jgi:hydroxymethylpyrimidine pyrophosphatase-like HAD family hydrolase
MNFQFKRCVIVLAIIFSHFTFAFQNEDNLENFENNKKELLGKLNANSFTKVGGLAFDIDNTILADRRRIDNPPETLDQYPDFIRDLFKLAEKGVRVAFITGSSEHRQKTKVIDVLCKYAEEKNMGGTLEKFTLYTNTGGFKIQYDSNCKPKYNHEFNNSVPKIEKEDIDVIAKTLKELAENKFGLSTEDQENWKKKYATSSFGSPNRVTWQVPWLYGETYTPVVVAPSDIQGPIQIPVIENRNQVQIALKPFYSTSTLDIRFSIVVPALQEALGTRANELVFIAGGKTNIDISHKDLKKSVGILNFIESNHLSPAQVFYFGDSFYLKQLDNGAEEKGNDVTALDLNPSIHVVAVSPEFDSFLTQNEKKLAWIGKTVETTHQFIAAIKEKIIH